MYVKNYITLTVAKYTVFQCITQRELTEFANNEESNNQQTDHNQQHCSL